MTRAKDRWLVLCAVIALVSVSVNVYLLTGSPGTQAIRDGDEPELPVSGSSPVVHGGPLAGTSLAASPLTPQLRDMLQQLQQSVKATQEQVEALALRIPEKAQPSAEQIARREAKRAKMREQLMLDLPEEERAVRFHERWLRENQEEVEAIAREVEQLKQLSAGSISN